MARCHAAHRPVADRPQYSLRTLLSCVTVLAMTVATFTQLGSGGIAVLPLCLALLVTLAGGGSWKDGFLLALYVYLVAACGIAVLLAMTVLAAAIGVSIG